MTAVVWDGIGARPLGADRCLFCVWAPRARRLEVRLDGPRPRLEELGPAGRGYFHAVVDGVPPGTRYRLRLDGGAVRPDPASRFQPEGVHGPSEVVDNAFAWSDAGWRGLRLEDYVTYELHVGTFTPAGTFEGAAGQLDRLRDLGVTAVELMPVAQFPGARNWGYDGACPYAVQASYGGPHGLRSLVDACHARGMAVVLDVVYNHLGPEGNYLAEFAPYFTDRYRTPWGPAVNLDGPDSDDVRRYFGANALMWLEEFHVDALRLDAVHAMPDHSARPFLLELAEQVDERARRLGRSLYLIAESSSNDSRLTRPRAEGGLGMHAQWSDDFHHALHTLLTGERSGYYQDFGRLAELEKAFREGFVFTGQYSEYRRRRHGSSSAGAPAARLVVCAQNHDQVGNRLRGERLATLVDGGRLRLAAAAVLLSPYLPLIFMGEEYGETAPFLYFVSHSDPELVDAVRSGRRREFAAFAWVGEPPDPQDERSFERSRLEPERSAAGPHRRLADFYAELLRLRRTWPAFRATDRESLQVVASEADNVLWVRRSGEGQQALLGLHFRDSLARVPVPQGRWRKALDAGDPRWGGEGARIPDVVDSDGTASVRLPPWSAVLFEGVEAREGEP